MTDAKAEARAAAFARRKVAHDPDRGARGAANLLDYLGDCSGRVIAAYLAIRTEIDPMPVMMSLSASNRICVPVIQAKGVPLAFREWAPDCDLQDGPFGARIPVVGETLEPDVLIVPLVAFDRSRNRLGYGGGFYDRTVERLRSLRPTRAVGFAYAAQEARDLPLEPTDQPLDAIVTEDGVLRFDTPSDQ